VDDGIATGASMRAAVTALRAQKVSRIVIAVPVAPPDAIEYFERVVEEMVCLATPEPFLAVGVWYEDFSQTTDEEVREILDYAMRLATPDSAKQSSLHRQPS
jgi:predicted phosphoribosyltransferase